MRRTRAGTAAATLAVVLVPVLAGCGPSDDRPTTRQSPPNVLATGSCVPGPTPTRAAPTGIQPLSTGSPSAKRQLPDLALPCLDGSGSVHLRQLRGPVLINLWASWCDPCRKELPALQRYAQRAHGQVTVIGVDTADTRDGAGSIVEDLGLTFPNLYDPRSQLQKAMDGRPLPVTLFVDADGTVVHVYNGLALDEAALDGLVRQHLGVVADG